MTPDYLFKHFDLLSDSPNAVLKLREMVLQLAIRGLLTENVKEDPEWKSQLERDKSSTIEILRIRRHPIVPPVDRDDFPFSLASSWHPTRMGEIVFSCSTSYGDNPSPDLITAGVVKVGNIDNQGYFKGIFSERGYSPKKIEDLLARAGDLLVVKSSGSAENVHSGKTALCRDEHDGRIVGSNFVLRLRAFSTLVSTEYIWRLLATRYSRGWVAKTVQTMTYPNLTWSDFAYLPVPLPPLEEQKRIVAKVDQLMGLCDELEERQKRRKEMRVRVNGACLHHLTAAKDENAFSKHWRRVCDHFDLLYDTPENVQELRQAILQLAVIGKLVNSEVNSDSNLELSMEEIVGRKNMKNGISITECSSRTSIRCLRLSSLRNGLIDCSDSKYIPMDPNQAKPYLVSKGDVFIVRGNGSKDLVGRAGVVNETSNGVIFPDLFIKIPLDESRILTGYFLVVWNSPQLRTRIESAAKTTSGIWKVNQGHIADISFRLPSLDRQKQIVDKVSTLMRNCDDLQTKLNQSRSESEKLMEAVVGELVG